MKKNIFKILGLFCFATACVEEMPNNGSQIQSPGDAVQFVAGLNNSHTKTIYGEEVGNYVKVKWVEGDMLSVYGTNALDGREQGTYKVTTVLTNEDGNSYAGDLQMIGDHGVQWGGEKSSFYAVYPSTDGKFTTTANGASVQTAINATQSNLFTLSGTTWSGVQTNAEGTQTMTDAIMYACNTGTDGTGLVNDGKTPVNLQFKPFSTVLKFTLNGVQTPSGLTNVYINQIDVTAPDGTTIAGSFPLTISSNATASAGTITNGSSTVTIKPQSLDANNTLVNNILVKPGEAIEFSVFTIPQANINLNGWKVRLLTSHGQKTFTINASTTDVNAKLKAGQIHKVKVPKLASLEDDFTFNPEEWISQLPVTVYLSEISMPGAWYATNTQDGYQVITNGSTDLEDQYAAGVRAFNIDCRLTVNTSIYVGNANGLSGNPGLFGYLDSNWREYHDKEAHATDGTLVLACAGTEEGELGKVSSIAMSVEDALKQLGAIISKPDNQDEFIEVILTISEKPFSENTGYNYIRGTVNPKMMLLAIAKVLNSESVKQYLYTDHIDEDTTIEDVLGKIVVKVNMNASNDKIIGYAKNWDAANPTAEEGENPFTAPMMITSASMAADDAFISGDILKGTFGTYTNPKMICGIDYNKGNSYQPHSLLYYNHQANNTSGNNQPTITQRKTAIDAIIGQASINHKNGTKAWYQLGIGGVESKDYTTIAKTMNQYVYEKVMAKMGYSFNTDGSIVTHEQTVTNEDGTTSTVQIPTINKDSQDISPVGIVLMNQCLHKNYYGPELIDAILKLNARFYMQRAGETNGGTTPTPAPAKNAAYAEVGEDAF